MNKRWLGPVFYYKINIYPRITQFFTVSLPCNSRVNRCLNCLLGLHAVSDSQFLADVLGNGVLVDEEVHGLGSHESLGHIPGAFVVAIFAP